jgi:hypothetical protein
MSGMTSSATPGLTPAADSWTVRHLPSLLAGRAVAGRGAHDWVIAGAQPIFHRSTGDLTLVLTLRDTAKREITITTGFALARFDAEHGGDPDWIIEELRPHPLEHGEYYAISA